MGTQKGRLFELAKMYHTYQKQNTQKKKRRNNKQSVQVKGEHFDEGKSISLSYNFDMYPEVLYDSHQRQTPVSQMSIFEDLKSEAFYVEPFDAEETVEIPYREASNEDDEKLEKIARGFASDSDMEGMEEDMEKMKDMEGKMDDMFKSDDESSAMEATDPGGMSNKAEESQPAPGASTKVESFPNTSNEEVKRYDPSDEEFARDIGAILQGQKEYNAEQKKTVNRGASTSSRGGSKSPKAAGDTGDMLDPGKNEHMIFEKIAQSMAFANSYDLGSIALNEKFELMDKEIEKEEVNKILNEKRVRGADDAEVIEAESSDEMEGSTSMGFEKYDPKVPLDNTNGGRLIKENVLQKGDLILTSSSGAFDVIDGALGSESIAGLYTGGGKILTKGDGGVLEEKALQPHMGSKGVMVALRHQSISGDKASAMVDSLTKLRPGIEKNQAENWLKINAPALSLHPDVCNSDDVSDKKKCGAFSGKIYLGTMNNDGFTCAESIINAFEKNQLGFVPVLSKEHNGSLKYLGHLKNKA